MNTLFGLIVFVLGIVAFAMLLSAIRLWRGNKSEYERNRSRIGSIADTIKGDVPTDFDGVRDYRVAAGLAIDTRTGKWKEQGRLSEEAISSTTN